MSNNYSPEDMDNIEHLKKAKETKMNEIDYAKIDNYIEISKKNKPKYLEVDDSEWANALDGARNTYSECDMEEDFNTTTLWSMIFFSASYFCKGMIWAETKAGLRKESSYPRY